MTYKPLDKKHFLRFIKELGWSLEKGGIDWNLYDENNEFLCSIKIAHGKKTKEDVNSVEGSSRSLIFNPFGH